MKQDGTEIYLGIGSGNTKVDSIQNASEQSIYTLKTMGIQMAVKPEYIQD